MLHLLTAPAAQLLHDLGPGSSTSPRAAVPAVALRALRDEYDRPLRYLWATLGVALASISGLPLAVAAALISDTTGTGWLVGTAIGVVGLIVGTAGAWAALAAHRAGAKVLTALVEVARQQDAPPLGAGALVRFQFAGGPLLRVCLAALSLLAAVFATSFIVLAAAGHRWPMLPLGVPMGVAGATACWALVSGELCYQRTVAGQVIRGRSR